MGLFTFLFGGGRPRARESDEEEKKQYGRLYDATEESAAENLREEKIEDASFGVREEDETARLRASQLERRSEVLRRRVTDEGLFGRKSHSSMRRLEKGIGDIGSAETPYALRKATERFRQRSLGKFKRQLQSSFEKQVKEDVKSLRKQGASDSEIRRAAEKSRREWDRKVGRDVRGMERRVGGRGDFRFKRPGF